MKRKRRAEVVVFASTGYGVKRGAPSGVRRVCDAIAACLPDARVILGAWDDDWETTTVATVARAASDAVYAFVGHSYGAWVVLKRVAAALAALGKRITLAWLMDPVPRVWLGVLQAVAGVIARRPVGKLSLPRNVASCAYARQLNGPPYGHPVVPSSPLQTVRGVVYVSGDVRHKLEPHESVAKASGVDHNELDSWTALRKMVVDDVVGLVAA